MIFRILAVLFLTATFVHALQVGDKAPSLKGVKSWYNGEVVDPGSDGKITILDFWATWCGPCRMIAPIVEELSSEYEGKAKVCKLDVDTAQKTAAEFGIRSIPTLLIFKEGKVADQLIGAVPKQQIAEKLDASLSN